MPFLIERPASRKMYKPKLRELGVNLLNEAEGGT
jgi:hypothetical protein